MFLIVLASCNGNYDGRSDTDVQSRPRHLETKKDFSNLIYLNECKVVDERSGIICGRVLAPDKVKPVSGAKLWIPSAHPLDRSDCITNTAGEFACHVPAHLSKGLLTVVHVSAFWYPEYKITIPVMPNAIRENVEISLRPWWNKQP